MKSTALALPSRQRGWAGLVVLLLALLIVGFLAKDALMKYGLSGSTVVGAPASKRGTDSSTPTSSGGGASIQSGAPIQRARAVDEFVRTQSEENKRKIDDATK